MEEIYTIASERAYFDNLFRGRVEAYEKHYQARPGMQLPIVIQEDKSCSMVNARWGMALKKSLHISNTVHMRYVLKRAPYTILIRIGRCAIPANCFIARKGERVYAVKLLQQRLFWMGGLYHVREDRDGKKHYEFTLLTTEPPEILMTVGEDVPVILRPHKYKEWLGAKHLHQVMDLADKTGNQWYDYFQIDSEVLRKGVDERKYLMPISPSYAELRERTKALKKIHIDEERENAWRRK